MAERPQPLGLGLGLQARAAARPPRRRPRAARLRPARPARGRTPRRRRAPVGRAAGPRSSSAPPRARAGRYRSGTVCRCPPIPCSATPRSSAPPEALPSSTVHRQKPAPPSTPPRPARPARHRRNPSRRPASAGHRPVRSLDDLRRRHLRRRRDARRAEPRRVARVADGHPDVPGLRRQGQGDRRRHVHQPGLADGRCVRGPRIRVPHHLQAEPGPVHRDALRAGRGRGDRLHLARLQRPVERHRPPGGAVHAGGVPGDAGALRPTDPASHSPIREGRHRRHVRDRADVPGRVRSPASSGPT